MIIALRVLAVVQAFLSAFTALVGSFADGGEWWDRLVLVGVHPTAAVLLLILVMSKEPPRALAIAAVTLLALNVVADAALALAIGTGASKGDWWLPLVFAVIPLIALPYGIRTLRGD